MKNDLKLLLDRYDEAWGNFQKYSGKEFWKGANGRPHGMYQGYLKTMYDTFLDIRDELVKYCDAGAKNRLCGEGNARAEEMMKILKDTLSRCHNRAMNGDLVEWMEWLCTYIDEVAKLQPVVTKVCKKCGRELPLDSYWKNATYRDGYMAKCRDCMKQEEKERNDRNRERIREVSLNNGRTLASYTPRELMAELARRGYTGKLEYVEKHTIDITNF